MVIECCVPYCKTKSTSGFHNFPANKEMRLMWLKAIQVFHFEDDALSNSFRKICKNHFRACDYQTHASGVVRLKYNSVPSQNLPNPLWMEHSYVNRQQIINPKTFKRAKTCRQIIPKKNPVPKEGTVDYDHGIVSVPLKTQNNEEEVRVLKLTISELKAKLDSKDKIISAQKKSLRVKSNQVVLLRKKLKLAKTNRSNVMQRIRQVFHDDRDKGKVTFFEMQLRNAGKHKNAHRYTAEEKSFCLAIYKQSPKTYRNILARHFHLPSKRTLGRHSAKLVFESGINCEYLECLQSTVNGMTEIDKNCFLVWDEISLSPHIDYSANRDVIDGFVEMIAMRRPSFATHALVFMIRGINRPYKQPISYFYTDGLKHFELAEMVRLVGGSVIDSGLTILGSVCDQCQINVSTISALMKSDREIKTNDGANHGQLLAYKIRDSTVIHVFDVPHLLKGTRNNLQTKVLKHFVSSRWSTTDSNMACKAKDPKELVATWADVSDTYDLNLKGSKHLLKKITPEHIQPNKQKMKVSTAAEVFSETYGTVMTHFSQSGYFDRDCTGTANVLLFFNDLFDSLNGSSLKVNQLNCPVTKESHHFRYWEYALDMLSKMRFIDPVTGAASNRTKNVQNWQSTIRGYYELSKKCFRLGMTEIGLRYCV